MGEEIDQFQTETLEQRLARPERSHFIYRDIDRPDTFRLLALAPGSFGDPFELSITHHSISENGEYPPFEAVSYVWGDLNKLRAVNCEYGILSVTENLFDCLQRLRFPDEKRLLWVDALCINQQNLEERTQQVGLMGMIYSKATKVLVWLGEEDTSTAGGIVALEELGAAWNPGPDPIPFSKVLQGATSVRAAEKDYWAMDRQANVSSIINRVWYTRAWTFQEICLSSSAEICCGSYRLPWDTVVRAWLMSVNLNNEPLLFGNFKGKTVETGRKCVQGIFAYWYLLNNCERSEIDHWCKLSHLLRLTQLHEANDPRDLIYSLLSLAKTKGEDLYPADYKLTVEEVFIKFVGRMIIEEQSVSLLSDCERAERLPGLPSWVPDWSSPPGSNPLWTSTPEAWRVYSVSHGRPGHADSIQVQDATKLVVSAAQIDTIEAVYSLKGMEGFFRMPDFVYSHAWRRIARGICGFLHEYVHLDFESDYPATGEPVVVAFLRTMSTDNFPTSPKLPTFIRLTRFPLHYTLMQNSHWLTVRAQLLRRLKVWDYETPDTGRMEMSSNAKIAAKKARQATSGRRLMPVLPGVLRRVTKSKWKIGQCDIDPRSEENADISEKALHDFYINMLRCRDGPDWVLNTRYLPTSIRRKVYEWLGYRRLDWHNTDLFFELLANTDKAIPGRLFFTTKSGLMGLGSSKTLPGDGVFCVDDSPVPFSLRTEGSPNTYILVGECYVHGIMDGELWAATRPKTPAPLPLSPDFVRITLR